MANRWLTSARKVARAGRALALCAVVVSLPAVAQVPGDEIINVASATYNMPPAQSNLVASAPVRAVVQQNVAAAPVIRCYSDATFVTPVTVTRLGDFLFIQADVPACNLNPALVETNLLLITSPRTGDHESFLAVETAVNSGVFRVAVPVPTRSGLEFPATSGNGILETVINDELRVEMDGCGGTRAVTLLLIDPSGVVFDSRSNAVIPGARVTLLDANTASPALVFQFDGVTPAPSTVVTGPDGRFQFPAVRPGLYRLQILPPPGYTGPSAVLPPTLPAGRVISVPGSYGGNFAVNALIGAVQVDVPLDAATSAGSGLFLQKLASRQVAEIADFIDYTIRVKNVSGVALASVTITDRLPAGFAYRGGSARFENAPLADPAGGAGPNLQFTVGPVAADATVTLTYRVRVGPGALQGDGINHAQAASDGPPAVTSNVGSARVQLQGGVFTDRAIVFGKIFVDANRNRVQDAGEPGIPGVRLYIEDGTYVITDIEGKFSIYGLSPRTHVIKVDNTTLPPGAKLEELSTRNAGSAGSRFVDLKRGEFHKADFAIANATPEVLAEVEKRRAKAESSGAEIESGLKRQFTPDGVPNLLGDPRGLPASGTVGGAVGGGPSAGGAAVPQSQTGSSRFQNLPAATNGVRAPSLKTDGSPIVGQASSLPPGLPAPGTNAGWMPAQPGWKPAPLDQPGLIAPAASTVTTPHEAPNFLPLLDPGTLNQDNSNLPGEPGNVVQRVRWEHGMTNLDNALAFLDLKDGDTLPMAQANVRVKGMAGAWFVLHVNGEEVPASRIGKRALFAEKRLEAWEFVGVNFRPGVNTLEVWQYDAFGNARQRQTIRVIAPDKLARIKIVLPKHDLAADGQMLAKISVRLEDARGVPVTARTPLTLEAGLGEWLVPDLDRTEPGVQVFLQGGRAEFPLKAPVEPGDSRVRVSSGSLRAEETLAFLPDLRPMIAVGIIEGQISLSSLKSGSILPARSRDGFEEELRAFAATSSDGTHNAGGRAAFFLKGKIKGEYLLTAGFDSEKDTRDRLFRDIQPDEFYPVYGDSATKGFEAQSTGRLYVRVDKRKCYLLYGDYTTASPVEARGLGNYSRSLTGVREHYEKNHVSANVWASQDSTRQVIEELPANGTSGPYFFRNGDGLVNSETVEILTRDRHQPSQILKTEVMTRFSDYEFEPFTGRILFKAPVPSLDANLNPISIRVTYEVDQGSDEFWVYGADAQFKLTPQIELGGAAVRDDNPLGGYGLYSANTTFKVAPKTYILGEVAHSETDFTGSGNAGRVELRHSDERTEARVYWGLAETTFSNAASILGGGRVESGAKVAYRLTPTIRLVAQGIETESLDNQGDRKGIVAGIEKTFTNKVRVEVGGRHSEETANPASATSVGATPNEVNSLRTKITAPVPGVKGAAVYGEYENDLAETRRQMVAAGAEYQISNKGRFYVRHELIDSLGGPFELSALQQRNTTVVGLDTAYMKDGTLFNEYRARDAISGREAEAATGLRNLWTVAEGVRLNTTFERVSPLDGGNQNEATAATGGLEYTRNPDWKATVRLELRTSTPNDSLLNSFGYARKLNRDWTYLGKTILYLVANKGPGAGDKTQMRFQNGLAWRQTTVDRWNGLSKYEYKIEEDASQVALRLRRQVHIVSLDLNHQPSADWTLSGHYAGKLALEDSNGRADSYLAHLLSTRATYDLTKRLDVGLNLSALFSGVGRSAQFGVGPEIGLRIKQNLRLAVGYNLLGFHDRDLSAENYTRHGVYIALRFKFDEATLGLGTKREKAP